MGTADVSTTGSVDDCAGVISEGVTVANVVAAEDTEDTEDTAKAVEGVLKILETAGSEEATADEVATSDEIATSDEVATSDASVTAAEVLTTAGVDRLSVRTEEIEEEVSSKGTSSDVVSAEEIAASDVVGVTTDVESELESVSEVGMLEVAGSAVEVDSGTDDDNSVLGSAEVAGGTELEEEVTPSGASLDDVSVEGNGVASDVESEVKGVTELMLLSVAGGFGGVLDEESRFGVLLGGIDDSDNEVTGVGLTVEGSALEGVKVDRVPVDSRPVGVKAS